MGLIENIKKFRKQKNITGANLGLMLNKSDSIVNKWEKGKSRIMADDIPEICKILNVTPNMLFDYDENLPNIKDKNITKHIEKYKKLDNEDKIRLDERMDIMLESEKYKSEDTHLNAKAT